MKRLAVRSLPWLITLLLVLFWVRQGGDLREFRAVVAQADWRWLGLAVLAQAAAYGAVAWLNELILRHYRVNVPWLRQYTIQYAMSFVEAALPSLAVSGLLLRARLLKPYGASVGVATLSTLVETALISASVATPALLVALFVLWRKTDERLGLLLSLMGGAAVFFLLTGLVVAIRRSRRWGAGWRMGSERVARWWDGWALVRWPQQLAEWPSQRIGAESHTLLSELGQLFQERPLALGSSLVLRTGCEALALLCCFFAFGLSLPLTVWLLIYTLTITVNTLGAVPGGVGLAEVLLATIYTQLEISPEMAAAVAFSYRVTGYWLPRLMGGLCWLWLERQHRLGSRIQEADL